MPLTDTQTRQQGIVADSFLTLFYPTFTVGQADTIADAILHSTDGSVVSGVVSDTGANPTTVSVAFLNMKSFMLGGE